MKLTRRRALVVAALVTMALAGWTAWRDMSGRKTVVAVGVGRQAAIVLPGSGPSLATAALEGDIGRDPWSETEADPFKPVSFLPPPPKVAPPAPIVAPRPVAPVFPYRYFGRMVGIDGKVITYLTRDDVLISIREAEILDNVYRIDAVNEKQVVVTYLPLNEQTSITARSAAE